MCVGVVCLHASMHVCVGSMHEGWCMLAYIHNDALHVCVCHKYIHMCVLHNGQRIIILCVHVSMCARVVLMHF